MGKAVVNKTWQAECDCRTLREAAEIQADRARSAAAKAAATKQIKELQSVVTNPKKVVTRSK
jgi:hypothetical protein